MVMGNPAQIIMDIREYAVLGKGKLYPWMYRFSHGMPWQGVGYESWVKYGR